MKGAPCEKCAFMLELVSLLTCRKTMTTEGLAAENAAPGPGFRIPAIHTGTGDVS